MSSVSELSEYSNRKCLKAARFEGCLMTELYCILEKKKKSWNMYHNLLFIRIKKIRYIYNISPHHYLFLLYTQYAGGNSAVSSYTREWLNGAPAGLMVGTEHQTLAIRPNTSARLFQVCKRFSCVMPAPHTHWRQVRFTPSFIHLGLPSPPLTSRNLL